MIVDVADGGLLTTVQDGGRHDWTHVGVPVSGAADPWSLAVANLLVGNEPTWAAVEMTIVGPRLVARANGVIGLAGADLGGRVNGGRRLVPGRSHRIAEGEEVSFPGPDDRSGRERSGGARSDGARGYLALAGGIDVPLVLGSRSTCLAGGFGGIDGRALQAGDRIAGAGAGVDPSVELVWPEDDDRPDSVANSAIVLRVLSGPAGPADALVSGSWRVAAAADRVGIRLERADGAELPGDVRGETLTHGLPWGAIQVPPDGRPIILSADHQTTGGYQVAAVVVKADLPAVGQLRPGDDVRLVATDLEAADRALREQVDALRSGAAAIRETAGWDRLASSAGG